MTELAAAIARAYGVEIASERWLPAPDADAEAFLRAGIEIGTAIGTRRRAAPPPPGPWEPLPQRPVAVPTAEGRRGAVARALAWAGASGVRCDGVEVRVDEHGGASIHATRALAAGETILVVPRRLMIVERDRDELAVWLALEARDPTSPSRAYLGAVPARFDELPVFRDAEDMAALAGTAAHALAALDGDDIRASHAGLPAEIRARVSLADFAWGRAIIRSRGFHAVGSVEPQIALVPVVDFFNHRPGDTTWTFDPAVGDLVIEAERGFAAGEGVGFTYGDRSNTRLLVQYGFTDPDAPSEAALVFEPAPDPVADVAGHLLWDLPLAAPARVIVGGQLDEKLFRALSVARLHAASPAERERALDLGLTPRGDLPWLGAALEAATFSLVGAAARRALDDLDAHAPRTAGDRAWDRSCALVRASERSVLLPILDLAAAAPRLLADPEAEAGSPLQRQYRQVLANGP